MMREADANAEADRKHKEEIETRNQADQAVYAAERMLRDAGDKVSATDRQPVDAAIEELKRAIEKNDAEAMKRGMEALNTVQHKIAEAMYRSAQSAGAGGQQTSPGADAGEPLSPSNNRTVQTARTAFENCRAPSTGFGWRYSGR
jgi:molecular chaperone DnaK